MEVNEIVISLNAFNKSNLDTMLFVLEPYGERLNGPTLIHAVMQIDLDHSSDCNSSGSQRDQGDPCVGGEQDEYLLIHGRCWNLPLNSPGMEKSLCYGIQLGTGPRTVYNSHQE